MNSARDLTIYKNIRKFRKQNEMSQEELARKVGYSGKSMISKVERGEIDLSDSMVNKFAMALGVSIFELRGDSDEHWEYLEKLYKIKKEEDAKEEFDYIVNLEPEYRDLLIECQKVKKHNIQQVIAILKTFE